MSPAVAANRRHTADLEWYHDAFSLCHAVAVVAIGAVLLWNDWSTSPATTSTYSFWTHTTVGQATLLRLSCVYYTLDTAFVALRSSYTRTRRAFFVLHHLTCLAGLSIPLRTSLDGGLVLSGFVLAEAGNPLRLLVQMWQVQGVLLSAGWDHASLAAFLISRFACLRFFMHVVWPTAASGWTINVSGTLLVCAAAVCIER
jgi:hypothetical protein